MNAAKRSDMSAYPSAPLSAAERDRSQNASAPSPSLPTRRAYKPKRVPYAGARQTLAFESSVKLTVNLLLAVVATTTLAKLIPYYQAQQQRLSTLQTSVAIAEQKNAELRSQFNHNFDPAQGSRIMQEQSGMTYPNQKKVIWTEPIQD